MEFGTLLGHLQQGIFRDIAYIQGTIRSSVFFVSPMLHALHSSSSDSQALIPANRC